MQVTQATLWYFSESLTTYKLWGKKKKKLVPRNQYRNKGNLQGGSDSVRIIRLKLGAKFWSLPHHLTRI